MDRTFSKPYPLYMFKVHCHMVMIREFGPGAAHGPNNAAEINPNTDWIRLRLCRFLHFWSKMLEFEILKILPNKQSLMQRLNSNLLVGFQHRAWVCLTFMLILTQLRLISPMEPISPQPDRQLECKTQLSANLGSAQFPWMFNSGNTLSSNRGPNCPPIQVIFFFFFSP